MSANSQAHRAAEALAAAHKAVGDAANAAAQHRWRSSRQVPFSVRITDLTELTFVLQEMDHLLRELAVVTTQLFDEVRSHYIEWPAPNGEDWPKAVTDEANEAWNELVRLRRRLSGIPVNGSHTAMVALTERVRRARNTHS